MPRGVQDGSDYDYLLAFNHFVDYSVGKALWITPSDVLVRMTTAIKQWIYCEFVEYCQKLLDKPVTQTLATAVIPCGNLDKSFSASGRETTCHFIASFAIGDVPLLFPGAQSMWDLRDDQPNVIQLDSRQPPIMEDHPARSRGEREADVLQKKTPAAPQEPEINS